ncbi:MAG TPA: FAD-dependent thymidylate synthase [Ktedonobacteraceae bacterium]|jgi:thymidylate synthase (FAD)
MPDIRACFEKLGGREEDGFLHIHTPVQQTPGGTPYLTHPGVVVLTRPQTNLAGLAGFLRGYGKDSPFPEYMQDPTPLPAGSQICKVAGQLCYMSFGRQRSYNADAARYFANLKSSGHGSVFEHASFGLLLYGVSRSVTHELVRHRVGLGFSQQSQRFVSGRMLRFVERPEYALDQELHALFLQRIEHAAAEYTAITERILQRQQAGMQLLSAQARIDLRKKVQQTARSLLPNETEAPIVVTGNARAWRHVISMRASAHAETEIRELAVRILLCLALTDPLLFSDYTLQQLPDGTLAAHTDFEKI